MSQDDRITGALLATAAGDALGAGYEFGSAPTDVVDMIGGGLGDGAPGEWTDDTAMMVGVAEVAARGRLDLAAIGERFLAWYRSSPPDMGNATRAVLGSVSSGTELTAAAAALYARQPRGAAGNGALMRTAPVALAHLGDDQAIAAAARAVAALTHADPLAGDSCVLWSIAIDRAIRESRLDGVWDGLVLLPPERRGRWEQALAEAEDGPPSRFTPNGFSVTALQAAYAAVRLTPIPVDRPRSHLVDALVAAVRIGDDTDTVAAIAGGLLGARWGASAVPTGWRRLVHGWPGYDGEDLVRLARQITGEQTIGVGGPERGTPNGPGVEGEE
jgi:ADP-ribosyl-[dinitrogen reductase] hydrolase